MFVYIETSFSSVFSFRSIVLSSKRFACILQKTISVLLASVTFFCSFGFSSFPENFLILQKAAYAQLLICTTRRPTPVTIKVTEVDVLPRTKTLSIDCFEMLMGLLFNLCFLCLQTSRLKKNLLNQTFS